MDFVNDKADPATPAASNPTSRTGTDLEAKYQKLALRAAIWPGDPRNNNPQLYFEKLPPELPADFPLPPDTELLGSLARSAQHIDLYLDSHLSADQLIEFYTGRLTSAGWQKMEPMMIPGHNSGFMGAHLGRNNTIFCQGSQGPSLTLQTNASPNLLSDVRINVNLDTGSNPCDQAARQRVRVTPFDSLIPTLPPPPGNTKQLEGGGSGGGGSNGWYSSVTLETDLEVEALAVHYNALLERASWELRGQVQAGQLACSQWNLKDKDGEECQGFLFIFKNFEHPSHYFLYVKAERSQAGSKNFQQNSVSLRF